MTLIASNGAQYALDLPDITIGRLPGNTIVLGDPTVSGQHAVIRRDGAAYLLTDLGSSNGTFVNGERITGSQRLAPGDQIQFGAVSLRFAESGAAVGGALRMDQRPPAPGPAYAPAGGSPQPFGVPGPANLAPYDPYGPSSYAPRKDRALALVLELLPGFFGFMGFGWMYADQVGVGLAILIGFWVFLCAEVGVALVTLGVSLFCTAPLHLILLAASAVLLYNQTRARPDLFGP